MATLSLVIPAYNEEARLPALLDALMTSADADVARGGLELHETLIVDDGSTDRTRQILSEAPSTYPRLKPVLGHERNRGKGAAIADGVRRAEGEYVLLADVDLSTPLDELHKLTDAMRDGAGVAIGSRAIAGATVERGPVHRKLMGWAFNRTVRMMTGLGVRDTQCGFKLMATDTAKRLLANQTCPGFAFDVELLMRADSAGLRIIEVPVLYIHDSRSRVRVVSTSLEMLKDVSRLAYRIRFRRAVPAQQLGQDSLGDLLADDPD